MAKTEVYSWRTDPELKASLEEAARGEGISLALLLERIVNEWLARTRGCSDAEEQTRLHRAAARCIGTVRGDDPERSANARKLVQKKLRKRHGRAQRAD